MPKSKAYKGGDYERELCKTLSEWWTHGERDDVFWRSSQSGGRATQRAKSGKRTHGSYGDIAAVDPIGEPLIRWATLELKRGSSHGTPWDLFESNDSKAERIFESCLNQAYASAVDAQSIGWALICRRDRKRSIIYVEQCLYDSLDTLFPQSVAYDIWVNKKDDAPSRFEFTAVRLEDFLKRVTPEQIIKEVKVDDDLRGWGKQ